MDPLRGDVFSPADGDYFSRAKLTRRCVVCRRESKERLMCQLFLGVLVGYALAVLVWQLMGAPC